MLSVVMAVVTRGGRGIDLDKIDIVAKAAASDAHMIELAIEEYPDH